MTEYLDANKSVVGKCPKCDTDIIWFADKTWLSATCGQCGRWTDYPIAEHNTRRCFINKNAHACPDFVIREEEI